MEMIHGAMLPIRGIMVDCAGELSVFIIASNALLRSSSRDPNASKLYPNPKGRKKHSIRVRDSMQQIQLARNDNAWEKGHFTCKPDDVQRYAVHSSKNIHRHAVGWTVMNLPLPKFTHLSAGSNISGTR